jgi:hypothetical protein
MIIKTDLQKESERTLFKAAMKQSSYTSTAAFLRHIVNVYLLKKGPVKKQVEQIPELRSEADLKLVEFTVSIPKFVRVQANALGQSYGLKPTAFLRNLITANITHKPVLVPELVNELRASNRELNAIGVNVNQLTKVLNRSIDLKLSDRVSHKYLIEIQTAIDKHTTLVNQVVARSNNVWRRD